MSARDRDAASRTDPERLERIIGAILRIGVAVSSACLAGGLALSFVGALSAAAVVLLHVGIVVLLLTPVVRVLVSVAEYTRQRDWVFVGLTLAVLVALVVSVVEAMYGRRV